MAREKCVLLDRDVTVQIAMWPAGRAGLAFAGDAHRLAFVHTRRNTDLHHALFHLPARAAAGGTMFSDDRSLAAALRAGGDHAKHAAKSLLCHAALPAALRTDDGAGAGLSARAFAVLTLILPLEFDGLLRAGGDFFQRKLDLG